MQRRAFLTTIAGAVAGIPAGVSAQPPTKPTRVGWLTGRPRGRPEGHAAILEGLKEHGYTGRDIVVETAGPESPSPEGYPALARQMVAGRPDIIIATNPYSIDAAVKTTSTIPIVAIDLESDPVARGWVASLSRPGGNLTGFFLDAPELSGKHLQFLREIKPDLRRVAVLGAIHINELQFHAAAVAAKTAGITLVTSMVAHAEQIQDRVAEAARQRVGALLALTSPLVSRGLEPLAAAALKHRLPTICAFVPLYAEAGGLIAYGPNFDELFRRAGAYAGRVLKGAKVGELPVQRPEKFDLAINLKTARALGLTLPVLLVQRADRVIE
jgi:putative tryptophan/tyrosine transport system substrate-binding protein